MLIAALRRGHTAQAMAALRNDVLNVLRYEGYFSIPNGIRRHGAALH